MGLYKDTQSLMYSSLWHTFWRILRKRNEKIHDLMIENQKLRQQLK